MKQSKEAYVHVAGYINRQLTKEVRRHRDKTNTIELDKAKTDADTALLWLNVLVKLADAQVEPEQPSMFSMTDFDEAPKRKAFEAY
jgi:hypothetical protein